MHVRPFSMALLIAGLALHGPLGAQSAGQSVLWQNIKAALLGPGGNDYFENSLKGAEVPRLAGTLVSSKPAAHPTEFLIAMEDDKTPDVRLRLNRPLEKPLPPGTPVTFAGIAKEFTAEPFLLTFSVSSVNRATVPDRN